MTRNGGSPASKVMDEAIELAIAEKSPYPDSAWFVNADTRHTEDQMRRAFGEGFPVVLMSADGSSETVWPDAGPH